MRAYDLIKSDMLLLNKVKQKLKRYAINKNQFADADNRCLKNK